PLLRKIRLASRRGWVARRVENDGKPDFTGILAQNVRNFVCISFVGVPFLNSENDPPTACVREHAPAYHSVSRNGAGRITVRPASRRPSTRCSAQKAVNCNSTCRGYRPAPA